MKNITYKTVFIAFRLLVCLGPPIEYWHVPLAHVSSLPFGFWSVWDAWYVGIAHDNVVCLHCLSAFGLFGTARLQSCATETVTGSSLPFGFWSVWDRIRVGGRPSRGVLSSLPFGFWSVWDEIRNQQ